MASALMAAYLRIVVLTLCDIEIYLRIVNKFLFFLLKRSQNLSMNPMTLIVTLILFLPLFLRNVNLLYFQLSPISSNVLLLLVFFLINLNLAQSILSLRNLTVIKMTCLIIYLFLICLSFLN
jgi:hypothetical protein